MKWTVTLLAILVLMATAFAHDEEHAHHHEPHHWQSAEMRHELLTQMTAIGMAGIIAGGYRFIRRRSSV